MLLKTVFVFCCFTVPSWCLAKCGESDTLIHKQDTLVTRILCYESGEKRMLLPYLNGTLHGRLVSWHPTGDTAAIVTYSKGHLHGLRLGFSPKGDTVLFKEYVSGNPVGIHSEVFPSGADKSKVHYNSIGEKYGLSETWREDGTRIDSTLYDGGKIVESREYFLSGKPRYRAWYVDGKIDKGQFFSPTGKVCGTLKNGTGKVVIYGERGEKQFQVEYKDGKEVGMRPLGENETAPSKL